MSTSTVIRLVRWQVRDWAACFSACTLPPVDEEPGTNFSTSARLASKALVFDPMGESRRREIDRKNSSRKKYEQEKASAESSNENNIGRENEDGSNDRRWPSFAEEEYIVFCFREDGAIHMIKERRTSEASDNLNHGSRNRRPANQKVCNHGDRHVEKESIASANEGDATLLDKLGDEEEENDLEEAWPPDEIKEVNHIETTGDNMRSAESSDSNQSDASSTGSFAFPVLGWEWMGSPVQMPKPEGIRLRKHRARAVRLHCCRF